MHNRLHFTQSDLSDQQKRESRLWRSKHIFSPQRDEPVLPFTAVQCVCSFYLQDHLRNRSLTGLGMSTSECPQPHICSVYEKQVLKTYNGPDSCFGQSRYKISMVISQIQSKRRNTDF
ncbi:hypothetical protein ATANTOWER_021537 [Ataeniobius toweri]|uniref:Uncharacterized protein n=1 Tax=Ataeniobius toweri TaxID=208326 RepID=A0ABU7AGF0_9TELE|nr:hypothetical protein [Ataeniobius toweri]